ncbi:VOC family protein [Marinomonas sp. C2222]|uniref:VOC family protein n=1 Tax=Marinomonas sargassi TaxID=2984494 RepID=A0ABT2YTV6_9GAMM|nr:VOC family protein [Marinomonas sargassi]MCV2403293.1 VOC family protein [Marinomonas sargassi]
MQNPVCWFDIYVSDMERAKAFYEAVLTVELGDIGDPADSTCVMKSFPSSMEGYGATGALVKMDGVEPGQNSTVVYFSCEDCSVEEGRVVSAGGQVERPKFSIGEYGFISIIKDTEGNVVGLHSKQ